jgi:DNA-binding MarR family transcriptional regulator
MSGERVRYATTTTLLRRTTQRLVSELMARLEAAGYSDMSSSISPTFHTLFENLDRQGTRLTELAARSGMTHQSMSELVAILERRGYLERRPDPSDARARLVCLTPEGKKLARIARAEIEAIDAEWTKRWQRAGMTANLREVLESALAEAEQAPEPPAK